MRANVALSCLAVVLCMAGASFPQSNAAPDSANQPNMATPAPGSDSTVAPEPAIAVPDAKATGATVEDPDGRPVRTSPEPNVQPPPPDTDRQDFRQNVKDVYFDFNRAELTSDDRAAIEKDAEWLKAHPNTFFTIAGGADERGDVPYNLFLSDERALVTRDALVKQGVPEKQILFATGWGKLYPVCTQSDESCWSQNRRSHLPAWPPPPENPLGQSAAENYPKGPVTSGTSGAAK